MTNNWAPSHMGHSLKIRPTIVKTAELWTAKRPYINSILFQPFSSTGLANPGMVHACLCRVCFCAVFSRLSKPIQKLMLSSVLWFQRVDWHFLKNLLFWGHSSVETLTEAKKFWVYDQIGDCCHSTLKWTSEWDTLLLFFFMCACRT